MTLDLRNLVLTLVALAMAGAAFLLPAIYTVGNWIAPPPPAAVSAPIPPIVRAAIWARAGGAGTPRVEPLTSWSAFRFVICMGVADALSASRADAHARQEHCVEDHPGILMAEQISRLHLTATKVIGTPRYPFSQVATAVRLTRERDVDSLLDILAATSAFGSKQWRGVNEASTAFFGKDAGGLTAAEAALLSVQIPDPAALDPWCHPDRARPERDEVLAKMKKNGALDKDSFESAVNAPLGVVAGHCGSR